MDFVSTEIIDALHHWLFFVIEAKARLKDPNYGERGEFIHSFVHPSIHASIHPYYLYIYLFVIVFFSMYISFNIPCWMIHPQHQRNTPSPSRHWIWGHPWCHNVGWPWQWTFASLAQRGVRQWPTMKNRGKNMKSTLLTSYSGISWVILGWIKQQKLGCRGLWFAITSIKVNQDGQRGFHCQL